MRKILWGMVILIVPAFVLWGGLSSLKGSKRNIVGKINDQKITTDVYRYHGQLANIFLLMSMVETKDVTATDQESLAMDLLVLLTKAKAENINVSDKEVIEFIKKNPLTAEFFANGKFDQAAYEGFLKRLSDYYRLGLTVRNFEEFIRDLIKVEKLFEENVSIEINDSEIKDWYLKDNQTAKVAYIHIPYEKFKVDIGITPKEVEEFFSENESQFKREPKVKLKYAIISEENEAKEELLKLLPSAKNLDQLKEKIELDITTTEFLGLNDPIKDIGWQPQINEIAFALKVGELGPVIQTEKGLVILEKVESQDTFIPALGEIEDEVRIALIMSNAKAETKMYALDSIKELINQDDPNLEDFAKDKNLDYKETDEFKYYDYIEGLGLDENLSKIIFSLEKSQVYDEPLLLDNGAYIIKLSDKQEFDPEDYKEKKPSYEFVIQRNLEQRARLEFINKIKQDLNLELYSYIK